MLNTLASHGYEARLVGGCVRDTLLGRSPHDYDVATSALPEEVERCFNRTVPTGIKHGTVTVIIRSRAVEVTTYRREGAYSDHRRPDSVSYTPSLAEDLSRRDFTINAMAMDVHGDVTDLFGGREDLSLGLIRCVGEPGRRFEEDALRMLCAVRFAARLGFTIEGRTLAAIRERSGGCALLSAERVGAEVRGILASPRPDMVWLLPELHLLDGYMRPGTRSHRSLAALPIYARTAHWCHALERGGYIGSTEGFLRALRMDNHTIRTASAAAHMLATGSRDYKRLLRDYGREAVLAAYPHSRRLRSILRSGECYTLAALAISGGDLAALGYSGRELGRALNRALDHVIDHPGDNNRAALLQLITGGKYDERT